MYINFGQRPFAYTPPTGFKALNTYNLPSPAIPIGAAYMAATTYTGNGTSLNISNAFNNVSFKPDLVWIKGRSATTDNALYDSVRGTTKDLVSNNATVETTQAAGLLSFNENGFSIGSLAKLNTNAATYVAWSWKAGETTVTNTQGTITSQVDANPTSGFSVVTYTGTGSNATVGHGLGVAPKIIIVKGRGNVFSWMVYHSANGATPATERLELNSNSNSNTAANVWNNAAPTSSVFSVGTDSAVNFNLITYIAYCFAEVAGFSRFGSYTGNNSLDGPFIYCGFRPRFIMAKSINSSENWYIVDSTRSTANQNGVYLVPNNTNIDTLMGIDILSNGFKMRSTGIPNNFTSNYIFAAFAETPFKYSLAR
jgi:hypothetical protein